MTVDDYNKMLDQQKGCCVVCGQHESTFKQRLCVDHDHNTGKVRGLLCKQCNSGIGLLQDDLEILKVAVKYLESCML